MKMFLPLLRLTCDPLGIMYGKRLQAEIEELTVANNNIKEVANENMAVDVLEYQDSGFY